ncbi:hypothetical protein B0I00_2570 [Novosphingobium kunmingense]|uniref:Uncharacterized protein n=1 Tax=Novosphingobium kunmingense TaxID=1211806 RepID=A0A2N0H4T7_9SPHN|nr:hypothetical protein [Novosphingobium kunmingense]PKB13942.1 hypothetical protein B0I00_2570 [Novosphingobium kunmingense]
MLVALLVPLVIGAALFLFMLVRAAIRQRAAPLPEAVAVGGVTNFFDTLGIGSFAPTLAWLNFRKLVPDRIIPQTMPVGALRWLVAAVVLYTGLTMLYAGIEDEDRIEPRP